MLTISQQTELASQLRLSVTRLARRLRQESADGLTPSQTAALATVARHGSITPSDLAAAERIQRPTATRVIGTLAEAELVERVADPEDRRSTLVELTSEGRDFLGAAPSLLQDTFRRELLRLREWEQTQMLATLQRIASMMDAQDIDAAPILTANDASATSTDAPDVASVEDAQRATENSTTGQSTALEP